MNVRIGTRPVPIGNHAGEALLKSEREYRTIIELSQAVIFSKDKDGYYHNPNLNAVLGMGGTRVEDVEGKTDYDFLPKEQADTLREIDKQVMESGKLMEVEEVLRGPQGKKVIYLSYKWPKYDDKGRITGINCFANDITELKLTKEKQQAIVKTALDGFWILNSGGELLEVNDSYCKMTGYTREELLKMFIQDIEAMENHEDTVRHIKRITRRGSDRFETRHKRKDGKIIDVEANVNYIDVEEGQIFVFLHDITERKQVEDKLRESERQYRLLAENAGDVIWTVDMNMRPTYISPSITRLLGYSVEEATAKTMEEVFTPASNEVAMRVLAEELAVENMEQKDLSRSRVLELELYRKDGSIVPVEIGYSFLRDADAQPTEILAIARNITERKHQEAKIGHLNQLLHAVFNVSEFIAKETDPDRLIKGVCDTLIEARGYHHVWIALLDKSGSLMAAAEAGLGEDFLPVVEQWQLGRLPACAQRILSHSEVAVTRDMASSCTACPLADKYGSGNALGVRLEHEGVVYGLLSICAASLYAEDEEELSLLLRIAGDIAFALHSIELEKQRRRAVDDLVELTNLL